MTQSDPPPELPGGQEDEAPDLYQLLFVIRDLMQGHLRDEPEDLDRWRAVLAVIARVLGDDDDSR